MKNRICVVLAVIALSTSAHATSGGGDKPSPPDRRSYSVERFKNDIDVLLPLATKLKGKCLADLDTDACEKADAIVSVLRELTEKNSGNGNLSQEEQKQLMKMAVDVLRTGILDTLEFTNTTK